MTKTIKVILIISAIIIPVAVLGVVFWPQQDQPSTTNTPATVEPDDNQPATTTEAEIITSEIDTSGWNTYRNEEYGFEVKYPKGWYHVIDDMVMPNYKINFFGDQKPPYENSYFGLQGRTPGILVDVLVNKNDKLLYLASTGNGKATSNQKIIFNNINSEQQVYRDIYPSGKGNEYIAVNFNNLNYYYTIEAEIYIDFLTEDKQLFYAILSTFKFIK